MSPRAILVNARALIAHPGDFAQGNYAAGARRDSVAAIYIAGGRTDHAVQAEYLLMRQMAYDIAGWQDGHDHADVLAAFDRAIAGQSPSPGRVVHQ